MINKFLFYKIYTYHKYDISYCKIWQHISVCPSYIETVFIKIYENLLLNIANKEFNWTN